MHHNSQNTDSHRIICLQDSLIGNAMDITKSNSYHPAFYTAAINVSSEYQNISSSIDTNLIITLTTFIKKLNLNFTNLKFTSDLTFPTFSKPTKDTPPEISSTNELNASPIEHHRNPPV